MIDADSLDRFVVLVPVVYLPVMQCPTCGGNRPHYLDDVMAKCCACGRVET